MKAHADVVVVGGGILGCGTAARLAEGGAEVVLVERAEIAAGASGRNHGLIFLPEHPGVQPLAELSMDAYRELSRATPLDLALDGNPFGLVIVVSEEGQWAAAEREAMVAARSGCPVERLDEAGLRKGGPRLSGSPLGGFPQEDGHAGDPGPGGVTVGDHAKGGGDRRDIGTLVQQNRGGQVLLGGSRAPSLAEEPEGADATAEIARRAAAMVLALTGVAIAGVWSGVR